MPTQVIASSLGLIGFIIAILAGLAADNPETTTIVRALIAMFICYVVGMIIGAIATRALNEHIAQYKQSNPMPSDSVDTLVINPEPEEEEIGSAQTIQAADDDVESRPAARNSKTTAKPRKGVAA